MQNKTIKPKQTISLSNLPSIIIAVVLIVGIGTVYGLIGYLFSGIKENVTPAIQAPIDKSDLDKVEVPIISGDDEDIFSDWEVYRNEEFGFEVKYPEDWERNFKNTYSSFQGSALMENSVAFRPIDDRSNVNFEVAFSNLPIENNDYCLNDKEETIYINSVKVVKCELSLDPDNYKDEPVFGYEGNLGTKVFLSKDSSHNYVIYFKDETIVEYKTVLNQILSTFRFIEEDETADENKPSIYPSKRRGSLLLLNGEKTGFPAYEFEKENLILFQETIYDEEKAQNHYSLKAISTISPYEIKTLIDDRHTNCMDNGRFLGEKNNVHFFETEIDAPGSYYELFLFNPVNMDFVLIKNLHHYKGYHLISLYSSASKVSFNIEKRSGISSTGKILLLNDNDIEIIFNEKSFTKKEVDQGKADYIKDIFNYNFAPFAPINTDEINNKESNDSVDAYLKYFPKKIPYFTIEWYKYEGAIEDFWANPDGYFDFEKNEFVSSL